jgi:MFS transporter, DHA3 family, macrolide efflux protein
VFGTLADASGIAKNFAIFKNRNFSIYFFGQFVSRIGNSVNLLALMWLAHILSNSAANSTFQMSLVLAASVVPRVLIAPVMGVLVDRWPKRKALIITDVSRFVLVAVLTVLAYTNTATIPALIVFSALMSVFSAVTMSAFRVVQKHIVEEGQLLQANSLFQTSLNVSQIIGPAIAGALIGLAGVGTAFAVDAATFAVSVVTLAIVSVREPERVRKPFTGVSILQDMRTGAAVALSFPTLRVMLPFMLLYNFLITAVDNLLIIQYVANVLHQGAEAVGLINSSLAIGSLVGSLLLSLVVAKWGRNRLLVVNIVISSLCIAATGITPFVALICLYYFIGGFCMSIVNVVFWTNIQEAVPSQHLGAVFGMLGSVFESVAPLSQLVFGGIALLFPVGGLMSALGLLAALAGTGFLLTPAMRNPKRVEGNTASSS